MMLQMTAPWIAEQTQHLLKQRGHAWLLQGPSGLGQYQLALELARAWLCEQPSALGACGDCPACHGIAVRTHPDLCVLMPETVMLDLAWPLSEKAQAEIDDKKRKPSKEIRIDALREAIEFSQRSSTRGRGKVILVFPAERMNSITANALLKTLEEPPGDLHFALASEAVHQLLPTIRSRCLSHSMRWPSRDQAHNNLLEQGVDSTEAHVALRAAGGRPDDALLFSKRDPKLWPAFPKAMARGELGLFKDWSPAELLDGLHKLCHDVQAVKAGAIPRFFELSELPRAGSWAGLTQWDKDLRLSRRTLEHPFNPGLMLEALTSQAQSALNSKD